jgi:hypothetical protein
MQLSSFPARLVPLARQAADTKRISPPSKLKIQYTGPDAEELLNVGPAEGKTWDVTVKVFVQEHDA